MGYKRKTFGDKKIYVLSTLGVFAVCAVVGGVLIQNGRASQKETTGLMVDINSEMDSVGINDAKPIENTTSEKETTKNSINNTTKPTTDNKSANNEKDTVKTENNKSGETATTSEINNSSQLQEAGITGNNVSGLTFGKESVFIWPVNGNIIIDYDMEGVVYHPTLDVYKCSDSVCIQSEEGIPVYAGAGGTVLEISRNAEIGNYVRMNLGNGYEVTYGCLKDIQVSGGLTVKTGDLIGYVGAPTKYYSLEGANLYIKLTENGTPVDPLEYLNYE